MCATFQYTEAHRRPAKGSIQTPNPDTDGAIHDENLKAKNMVSVDHFESRLKGRTYSSLGGLPADKYVGYCMFVDSMRFFLHVEQQFRFSSSENIRVKQTFEQLAMDHGVLINSYKAEHGFLKADAFVTHIKELNQELSYCRVNAHHTNGAVECAIRTVSKRARALILNDAVYWKDAVTSELWPMAVDYAV